MVQGRAVVPVRYDAGDHTKVALDVAALEAKHRVDRAQADDRLANQRDDAAVARAGEARARWRARATPGESAEMVPVGDAGADPDEASG